MGAEQYFSLINDYVRLQKQPNQKDFTSIVVLIFGAFMMLGGMLGFALKGSKISLLAGFILGGAFIYDSWLLTHTSTGRELGLFLSGLVALVFGYRWYVGRKVMAIVIVAMAVFVFGLLFERNNSGGLSGDAAAAKVD